MYQQSRKILIFLLVIFLADMIAFGNLTGKISSDVSGGELWLWMKYSSTIGSRDEFQALRSSSFLVLISVLF
jgi:hypothetical protein